MYIVKVDLIDQVVRFLLLLVLHQLTLQVQVREVPGKSKWKFKMAFAIRRPTPLPP